VVVEVPDRGGQHVVEHDRVGVQQQEVATRRHLEAGVAAGGEPEVLGIADEPYAREALRDHVRRAVAGGVVDHDQLGRHTPHPGDHRLQAGP
jgi:hypothetical protein